MRLYGRWRGAHRRCRPSASLMNNGASLGKWTWNRWENYLKKKKKEFSVSLLYNISAAFSFGFQPFLFFMFLFLYMCVVYLFPPIVVYCSRVYLKRLWCDPVWTWNILFFSPFPMLSPPAQQLSNYKGKKREKKRENKNISEPEWVIQGIIKVSDLIYQWPSRARASLPDPPTAAVS
jgi:hypothetical protein